MHNKIPKKSVFLADIRSGWNVGSFFRTADSLGLDHIYLSGITPFPPHKEISKTALDADIFVSWTYAKNSQDIVSLLKKNGVKIIAMELTETAIEISSADFSGNVCLVMGNEISGVSPEILDLCDEVVYIPMKGKKQSMNVSVAGSIGIWEMMK